MQRLVRLKLEWDVIMWGDLKIQPAFGFWARHVKGFILNNCKINAESKDGRYAVVLDDVIGAEINNLQVTKVLQIKKCEGYS